MLVADLPTHSCFSPAADMLVAGYFWSCPAHSDNSPRSLKWSKGT